MIIHIFNFFLISRCMTYIKICVLEISLVQSTQMSFSAAECMFRTEVLVYSEHTQPHIAISWALWLWTVCPWHEPISPRVLLCSDSSTCLWPVPGLGHVPERVSGPRLGTWTASHLWSLWSVERIQNYWVPLMTARAWPASPQTAASK